MIHFEIKKGDIGRIDELADILIRLSPNSATTIIAIDGCGGSGKSTLADSIASSLKESCIVRFDDFFKPSGIRNTAAGQIGSSFDWERFRDQVLEPLSQNKPARYQVYDWTSDTLTDWMTIDPGKFVIVEGIYTTRKELREYYDYTIWIECSGSVRLKRGIERDGESMRGKWETEWMVQEAEYIEAHEPQLFADLIVDGSGDDETQGEN